MEQRKKVYAVTMAIAKLILVIVILILLVAAGRKAYSFGYRVFAGETVSAPPGKKVAVTIEDGISAAELSDLLKSKGLIKDERVFQVQYMLSEYKDKLQGGSYILNTSQTSEEMLEEISGENESESETESSAE